MNLGKKVVYTENNLDADSGELISRKWITRQNVQRQNFVIMYLDDLSKLNKLSPATSKLMQALCVYLEYDTNEFYLNPQRKKELIEYTGLKLDTINQGITTMVKKNLLIRINTGTYQMNPLVFFKGSELQRAKYLELIIRYEICPDC